DTIGGFGTSAVVDADGAVSGNSLPPAALEYSDAPPAGSWKSSRSLPRLPPSVGTRTLPDRFVYSTVPVPKGPNWQFLAGDFDGDGRTDGLILSVLRDPNLPRSQGNRATAQTAILSTHARLAQQVWVNGTVPFPVDADWNDIPLDGRNQLVDASVADVNGDGFDDLILMSWAPVDPNALNGMLRLKLNAALSNGN